MMWKHKKWKWNGHKTCYRWMLTVQRKKNSIMRDGIPINCQIYKIRAVIYFYITKAFFVYLGNSPPMKISFSCSVLHEEVVVIELCSGADVTLVELSSRQKKQYSTQWVGHCSNKEPAENFFHKTLDSYIVWFLLYSYLYLSQVLPSLLTFYRSLLT